MLKKVLAVAALAGAAALTATPASAEACVSVYLEANGSPVVNETHCV